MPPILPVRQERGKAISRDERLAGLHQSKLVFTDLTLQKSHREQSVVVREPDGTLRDATWDEWERMCQVATPPPPHTHTHTHTHTRAYDNH